MDKILEIERTLLRLLKDLEHRVNPILLDAIEYSLFPGGKRIRPILCIKAFESVGGIGDKILPYACAMELVHTSSLIKDDLMDNDDYRRGQLACHKKYGQSMALMAADLLTIEAFALLDDPKCFRELLNAIRYMCVGQSLDCQGIRNQEVNKLKTGSLFEAAYVIGGIIGGATDLQINALRNQGSLFGIEFQNKDDLADGEDKYVGQRNS